MKTHRWKQRPEGSTWGDFGADDQIGRLNLLTAERRLAAIAEVHTGESFCLSLPLDYPGGTLLNENRHPPVLRPCLRHGGVNMNFQMHDRNPLSNDVLSDDLAILHLQYSTQWDGLAHVGALFDVVVPEIFISAVICAFHAAKSHSFRTPRLSFKRSPGRLAAKAGQNRRGIVPFARHKKIALRKG
ncbi:hypothetical protein Q8947_15300, partial [Alcaligenaceae bacterium LG-2]|nr:hypothetical protein [Alcaligenaceae bacterium LG-2]